MYFNRENWLGYKLKSKCYDKLAQRSKVEKDDPQLIALATCISPKIKLPGVEEEFEKEQLGLMIVFFDIATVLAIIAFTKILIGTQEEYADMFDQATIEMTDFTIRVKNLPHHKYYNNNDDLFRAILTSHFE